MTKYYIYFIYFLAFILRLLKLIPNMELVTLSLVLASTYLSRNSAVKLTLILMLATDLIIGNTSIFIFTWSGFLIPVLIISKYHHCLNRLRRHLKILAFLLPGLASNLFFFLWTNFGVWLLDSWNMYPKTLAGLIHCYINGLPFLKNQLSSTLVFVPLGFWFLGFLRSLRKNRIWSLSPEIS